MWADFRRFTGDVISSLEKYAKNIACLIVYGFVNLELC